MKQIIDFCRRLDADNNREWFNAHKEEYKECKLRFEAFVNGVIEGIHKFDETIGDLDISQCTYRIYRDTRFSANKAPYKVHFGAFIAPGGKKSGYSGYYFQAGVPEAGYEHGCFLATGNYYAEPAVLRILREDIDIDEDGEFAAAIAGAEARGFALDTESMLKRIPKGYAAEHPRADLLRLRNFCLVKPVAPEYFTCQNTCRDLCNDFESTMPFLRLINRAVAYSKEQQ